MSKSDRFRRAVRGVWEQSHESYVAWSDAQRTDAQPAIDALLTWLSDAKSEGDLIARYWEVGDPPGEVLKPHLPPGIDPADALTMQEECFWRRVSELEAESSGA